MNITTNSNLLSSLTSLIDPNLRQQQQRQKAPEQTSKIARNSERQNRINANRVALKDLQARLRADNLAKLKTGLPVQNTGNAGKTAGSNPNLRENPGRSKAVNSRPGQIIDIKV